MSVALLIASQPSLASVLMTYQADGNHKYTPLKVLLPNMSDNVDMQARGYSSENMDYEYINTARGSRKMTLKASLVEFSNIHKGEVKTRREIVKELSVKYGHNKNSILPAEYEISLSNGNPKLFKRVGHGAFLCLGYDVQQSLSAPITDTFSTFINEEDKHRIFVLLMAKFKNGFRTSSNIDFERFTNYFVEEYGEDFEYDSSLFNKLLKTEALNFDDRAYVYDSETLSIVHHYLSQMNAPCVFIDSFYSKHMSELYSFNIFSVEMLKAFIEKNYYDISVKRDYIYLQCDVSPSDLIDEVFCEREAWSYDELQERLPHLKMDTIRQTLNSSQYFRIAKRTYTHVDNMDLPEDEEAKIVEFVAAQLMVRDYVIANELDLVKLENLNPHCPFSAIRDAVFVKFLSDKYDKCGQVITRKGERLRILDILEQYCLQADTVTFDELNGLEATFDPEGRTHSQCLIAGHNMMVRASEELFVSDNSIDFDVARIDEIIALYCVNNFIPLRGVTDFSLLPYPGYQWNWFLLESYVRRFSQMFKFDARAVNSANIGAIVRRTFAYKDYDEILALALAKSSIELNDKVAVGNYLFDAGYIGWHTLGKNEKSIIQHAKTFRKGGAA